MGLYTRDYLGVTFSNVCAVTLCKISKREQVEHDLLSFGGKSENKFELCPHGMRLGISLHAPDIGKRQLAAGGEGGI